MSSIRRAFRRALGYFPCVPRYKEQRDPQKGDPLSKIENARKNRFEREEFDLDDYDDVRGTRLSTGTYHPDSSCIVYDFQDVPLHED